LTVDDDDVEDAIEELQKADWYINREIEMRSK
jgi:hypothetical protein